MATLREIRIRRISAPSAATCALVGLLCVPTSSVRAESDAGSIQAYKLGPQDKIRVKVFAWRPSVDEVYEWKALNDVYSVGATGDISLPLVGDVAVGGMTLPEVSGAIGRQMRSGLGLADAPQASVEIVEFRPFYITGSVQKPGEYSYRPGLTIIKAVSLAGGLTRLNQLEALRLDRDTIATAGERSVNTAELDALIARRARLEAESAGAEEMRQTSEIKISTSPDQFGELMQGEQAVFASRLAAYNKKMDSYNDGRTMLKAQLDDISRHMVRLDEQVKVSKDDLNRFDEMLTRRLTTNARRSEVARLVMQAEDDRVRMKATEVAVKRDLVKSDMDIQDARETRMGQSLAELRAVDARIDALSRRVRTADRIVSDAAALRMASLETSQEGSDLRYTIVRDSVELEATETTVLQPGDTIKVTGTSAQTVGEPQGKPEREATRRDALYPVVTQDYGNALR